MILKPEYNESLPMEIVHDFHGCQILRVNTIDVNIFLESGKKFDMGLPSRTDSDGSIKCIYVIDKVPPLSSVLNFVQTPFAQGVNWGAYAVILPQDTSLISKFIPIVTYGMMFTPLKDKYALKTFNSKYRDDLTEVIKWLDEVTYKRHNEIDVSAGQ